MIGRLPTSNPLHWLAVASVSWQDQMTPDRVATIHEAMSRPVVVGEVVVLFDGSDGADDPMVALGRVTSVDDVHGLIQFRRVSVIVRPVDW